MTKELAQKILDCAVANWGKTHAGTSSLDISRKIGVPNWKVKAAMLDLEAEGKCTLNKDAKFFPISLPKKGGMKIPSKPALAHVMFPNKAILEEHFYASGMERKGLPIYKARLIKGADQYEHVCFSEDVLTKYLDRPELYDVEDSLSGGSIRSNTDDEATFIYVRHGRRQLANGRSAVLAIYKDLASLDEAQQRYWNGFEITNPETAESDPNYSRYLVRTFEGAFIDFENPLQNLLDAVKFVNEKFADLPFFRNTENSHLRIPVENTEKAFYNSCSELFKLIGPDSLVAPTIKKILVDDFGTTEEELMHMKSGRALSTFQQLELLETKAGIEPKATTIIDEVKGYRLRADHGIVSPTSSPTNYVEKFHKLCDDIAYGLMFFVTKLEAARAKDNPEEP